MSEKSKNSNNSDNITMYPIGYVQNDVVERASARNMKDRESRIVLKEEYAEGLYRLDGLERIQVLFHFHLSKGFDMIQTRRYDGENVGVFASRSPDRPNGIGVTIVDLVKVEGNVIYVTGLDAVNNTPVLDIKPQLD
ncbi:SAM-dependent methyltransferase [Methanolobus sp. WCC4]|uniref:SAM-dependent methyltransferase n=1 Tax=Methanolobus sp. WCC4 TaxID=3125784 RepID=UPI0030F78BF6